MKKRFYFIGLFVSMISYSQQEIKIDIADALVIKTIEVSYENYITDSSSFGISGLFNLTKEDAEFRYNENTMFTPYYRNYFTTSAQWNFFGEGFIGINSGKNSALENYTDAALGIAVGTKYVSENGLTIDAHLGLGRNLFGSKSPVIVPRVGLNVGWRF